MKPRYRDALPQLSGDLFLTDAGLETDLIFNHRIAIREFAAHTLLENPADREAMTNYFRGFLALARDLETGFILDSQTWKAHPHWAADLGVTEPDLKRANEDSLTYIAGLRDEFSGNSRPIVLNAIVGPCGDAYGAATGSAADEAERYHAKQLAWIAATGADMVTATTYPSSVEAIGFVRAARNAGMPAVVSFTVETDGKLPSGQPLGEAILAVDEATNAAPAYFLVNCAHPAHFFHVLEDAGWARRLRGVRCNASRKSHAELDQSETLDDGNPAELGDECEALRSRLPWLNIFGGCCGSDLRHVTEIARRVR
jgi:homocysteine S-methyltransferase